VRLSEEKLAPVLSSWISEGTVLRKRRYVPGGAGLPRRWWREAGQHPLLNVDYRTWRNGDVYKALLSNIKG